MDIYQSAAAGFRWFKLIRISCFLIVWMVPIVHALLIHPQEPKLSTDTLKQIAFFSALIFLVAFARYRWHDVPYGKRRVGIASDAWCGTIFGVLIVSILSVFDKPFLWWGYVSGLGLCAEHCFSVTGAPMREISN